ncbi:hypothetical protein [Paenibacillus taichungensis]|uniref:hypothetical protein n=1 Tax=Paenibacillus taichungensis TaxID=484184 RepID=UPI0039A53886
MKALWPSLWQDIHYAGVDITNHLVKGENELEVLTVSLLKPMPAISFPAYLIGSFAIEDQTTLTVESEQVTGVWNVTSYMVRGNNVIDIHVANTLENLYGKSSLPSGMNGSVKLVTKI